MPTPTSNHAALALLRADPEKAISKYGFVVDSEVYTTGAVGGGCLLHCTSVGGGIYKLTAQNHAGDYLYPYVNGSPGVGSCTVPVGQASDGVLVVTGGMNGCSLQVNKSGTDFIFYHDNNGNSMARQPPPPGTRVCRVDYRDYAGALDIGRKIVDGARHTATRSYGYEYYLLTIRHQGRWKVYVSALIRTTTRSTSFWSGRTSNKVTYKTFIPTLAPLLTSFDDA